MRRNWLLAGVLVLVMAGMLAGVAWAANPAITRWAGRPDTTVVTITGTDFGSSPTWAYYEDFEGGQWFVGASPDSAGSVASSLFTIAYNGVASYVTQMRWMTKYADVAALYPWSASTGQAHSGSKSMMFDASKGKKSGANHSDWIANAHMVFGVPSTRVLPTSATELFVSCWWYDAVDSTLLKLSPAAQRAVLQVDANAAAGNLKGFWMGAGRADLDSFRLGTVQNTTADVTTLIGDNSRYPELVNRWNRSDLWAKVGNGTNTSQLYSWLNYAVMDSFSNGALGASNHFDTVKFNGAFYFPTADSTKSIAGKAYYDDIYISDTPVRIELGDKITYEKCTKRYIQPLVSWSATAVSFRPVLKDLAYTGATASATHRVYVFVVGPNGTGSRATANTAIDSLEVLPPEMSPKSATTTLNAVVQATVDSFSVYNPNLFTLNLNWQQASARSSYTARRREPASISVNWGDSTTPSTATRTYAGVDSVFTHTYVRPGTYTIRITATNAAGTTTRTKSIEVKDGSVRRLTAVGTIALPNNVGGENVVTIQPLVGNARVRAKRGTIWDSRVWTVTTAGTNIVGNVDSLRVLNITTGDTIQVFAW